MAKKASKLIKIISSIIVFLVVLLIVVILLIDPIAKTTAEKVAPLILGVPIELESIHISVLGGRVELKNFVMGNPDGYASDHSIKMGEVVADIEPSTVFGKKIHVEELVLRDVNVNYETAIIKSNLQDIVKRIEDITKKDDDAKASGGKEDKEEAKRLQIDKIEFESVGITVLAKGISTGVPIHVSMNPIGPFGTDEEGISPAGLAGHIVGEILLTALDNGGDSIKDAGKATADAIKDAGKATGDAVKDAGKAANDTVKDAGKATADAVKNAGDSIATGIKGLFGGNKEEAGDATNAN